MGERWTPFLQSLDVVESFDNAQPCPTYPQLRDDWFEHLQESVFPWDEIEPANEEQYTTAVSSVESLFKMFLAAARSRRWLQKTTEERLAHIDALVQRPHVPQRTPEWYAQSKEVLTASEFSAILGTPRSVGTCVLKKVITEGEEAVAPRLAVATQELSAMDWGVRFEPIVKQILAAMWGAEILDVGRIIHATDSHLAASPDGLLVAATDPARVGRLLEIKCPIRREITGKIPFEYWCQMQIQMEVTDIDECDYVEVKIASPYKEGVGSYKPPAEGSLGEKYNGHLWLFQEPNTLELVYAYTHIERKDFERLGWNVVEVIPWHLESISTSTVNRDEAWFASTEERRREFWAKVAEARAGTFVLPPSSRPPRAAAQPVEAAPVACMMLDD